MVTPPTNWADVRDRWQLAHVARTATSMLAFLLLIAAGIRRPATIGSSHPPIHKETQISTGISQSALGAGHEVLFFVLSELAGKEPRAIFARLDDHLEFLSQLSSGGILVMGGPLETPDGQNSGDGIYVVHAESLSAAEQIVAADPLHQAGIRIPRVSRWNRKKDWSALPEPGERPWSSGSTR